MPLSVIIWIELVYSYCYAIFFIIVIVRLVISPVLVPNQWSSVSPLPITFFDGVKKSNPVIIIFVGRQEFRFNVIIFFRGFNLYQPGMPSIFAFVLRIFPFFRWRKQLITWCPMATPLLLTSWVKKLNNHNHNHRVLLLTGEGKRRNEREEWDVAWVPELYNHAECNTVKPLLSGPPIERTPSIKRTLSQVPKLTSYISLYDEALFSGHLFQAEAVFG